MNVRAERLGEQIRGELSLLLQRSVRDPALSLVTVTHVRMTRDLQHARVYFTTLGDTSNRRQVNKGLRRAGAFLRGQLGRRLSVRFVPELTFVYDETAEREERIAQVIEDLGLNTTPTAQESDTDASYPENNITS